MKIHELAARGDRLGVMAELDSGVAIEALDGDGRTPLAVAAMSSDAGVDVVELLLHRGADASQLSSCGNSLLTLCIEARLGQGLDVLAALIDAGAPLDTTSSYGESPLSVAAREARVAAIDLLVLRGANPSPLGWTPLFEAIAAGDEARVERLLAGGSELEARDRWSRTPLLWAIHTGQRAMAERLLAAGCDRAARGWCGATPLHYAVSRNDAALLEWLVAQGFDVEACDEFGSPPLHQAVVSSALEAARSLIGAGASLELPTSLGRSLMSEADSPSIAWLLADAGLDLCETSASLRRKLVGASCDAGVVAVAEYSDHRIRVFGQSNPQRMNNSFWDRQVATRESAIGASRAYGYLDIEREPTWCFERFGQSLTPLPDGRFVEIGGEHEDYYDPDFCIYNDVVVHDRGRFDIYGYPEDVFPPTDFHSATRLGSWIYLIGSLGYSGSRQFGATPVYRLDCRNWAMERLDCEGDSPGWIHGHRARGLSSDRIEIRGGLVDDGENELRPSSQRYVLDVSARRWSRAAD